MIVCAGLVVGGVVGFFTPDINIGRYLGGWDAKPKGGDGAFQYPIGAVLGAVIGAVAAPILFSSSGFVCASIFFTATVLTLPELLQSNASPLTKMAIPMALIGAYFLLPHVVPGIASVG